MTRFDPRDDSQPPPDADHDGGNDPAPTGRKTLVQAITVVALVTIAFAGVCTIVAITGGAGNQLAVIGPMIGFAGIALNQLMSTWRAEKSSGQIHQDVKVVKQQTNGELDGRIQQAVRQAVPPAVTQAVAEAVPAAVAAAVKQAIAETRAAAAADPKP